MNYQRDVSLTMVNEMIARQRQRVELLSKEAAKYKGGQLIIRTKNGSKYYTERSNNGEKGITRNICRIQYLARKELVSDMLKEARAEYKILTETEEKLRKNHQGYKVNILDYGEIIYAPNDLKWMKEYYPTNNLYREHLSYITKIGIKVRSKSELAIATCVEGHGVPYRYEQELILNGKRIYPDFILKKPDGSEIIWEHFGLMDSREYAIKASEKLELYRRNGYRQHTNLICTYEEDIRSQESISKIIRKFVLF